jgi:hypothetical protein
LNISEDWIKSYIDALLKGASLLPPGRFQDAVLLRAEHVMDLVDAHRESKKEKDCG